MKSRIIKIAIVAALIVVAFVGVKKYQASQTVKKTETTTVKRGNLKQTLTVSGQIAADEHATLRFQTSGYMNWVGVKEGDYVQKYQTIASLDQREVRDTLNKYLAAYMKERWTFESTKDASGDPAAMSTAVRRALDSAQFNLNSAVLDVELKNLAVQFSSLWTPIEGLVTSVKSPYAGVNITPTQAEFEVVNPKTVYFSATADQTEVTKISVGEPAILKLDAYPDQEIPGTITRVAFTPDTSETGTVYDLRFAFNQDNSDYRYKLGMTGDLTFTTSEKGGAVYLPSKFVKSDNGKKYVYVLSKDKKVKTPVQIGLETDDDTEITSGLVEGQTVSQ